MSPAEREATMPNRPRVEGGSTDRGGVEARCMSSPANGKYPASPGEPAATIGMPFAVRCL